MISPKSAGPYLLGLDSNGSLGMGIYVAVVEGLTSGVTVTLQTSLGGTVWTTNSTFTSDNTDVIYGASGVLYRFYVTGTPVAGLNMSCTRAVSAAILR